MQHKFWTGLVTVWMVSLMLCACGGGGGGGGGASPTYSLSGTVKLYYGIALPGVTITLSGPSSSSIAQTDKNGNYSFTGLANGSYTVTPSLANYILTPTNKGATINGADEKVSNFIASTASGTIPTINEFTVTTAGSEPYGITAGSDGNLWFTEENGNKIGRITTTGSITEYPLPTFGSAPEGIAAGPDGNLWFTE